MIRYLPWPDTRYLLSGPDNSDGLKRRHNTLGEAFFRQILYRNFKIGPQVSSYGHVHIPDDFDSDLPLKRWSIFFWMLCKSLKGKTSYWLHINSFLQASKISMVVYSPLSIYAHVLYLLGYLSAVTNWLTRQKVWRARTLWRSTRATDGGRKEKTTSGPAG